jgi:hypothetical protein
MKKTFIIINSILLLAYLVINLYFSTWKSATLKTRFIGEFQTQEIIDSFQVVNTGTSHGSVSFDWKNNPGINGFNLGRSGQPPYWDRYLLEYYKDSLSDAIVILPISFHTLCMSDEYVPLYSLYESNIPFLGIGSTQYSVGLLRRLNKDIAFPTDSFNFEDFKPSSIRPSSCDAIDISRNIQHIDKIIEAFDYVILVTTPYYHPSLDEISYFQSFYEVVNRIAIDNNVPYYDYSRDERFSNTDYFYNSTHLNTLGRTKFTNIVIDEIMSKQK